MINNVKYKIKINNLNTMDSHDTINAVWNGFIKTSVENDILFS